MRGSSLLLRVLVLAVLLPVTAAVCIVILIGSGALHPRLSHMAAAGAAILIIATLAAALSTFSPKFRPTPLLTPLLAGVFAALLATGGLYGAQAYIANKHHRPVAATAKAKPVVVPVKPPADDNAAKAPVEPDPRMAAPQPAPAATQAPQPIPASAPAASSAEPAAAPSFDSAAFEPANSLAGQPANAGSPTAPTPPAADAAQPAPQPVAATPPAAPAPPATADAAAPADQPVSTNPASGKKGKPAGGNDANTLTIANVPVPAAAPVEALPRQTAPTETATPEPNAPLNLNPRFDPSGPNYPQAEGPPMALAGGGGVTATHHSATPPLPRIRPCGGAGPACP